MNIADNEPQSNIPLELWAEILTYLPVKSLVRFRSVSKSWKSTIENPNFTSINLKRCPNNIKNPYLIFWEAPQGSQRRWILRHSETFCNDSPKLKFPIGGGKKYEICNSVDGLILLVECDNDDSQPNILIWNPSINKVVHLPPHIPSSTSQQPPLINLCLLPDVTSADYKVVMVHSSIPTSGPFVDIFSLKTRSWQRVIDSDKSIPVGMWLSLLSDSACIGSSANWIGGQSEGSDEEVVSFDVSSNSFSFIPLPPQEYVGDVIAEKKLIVLSGSVLGLLEEFHLLNRFTIWVMEEGSSCSSWSKRYQIDVGLEGRKTFCVTVQKRDLLLWGRLRGLKSWRLCDLETGVSKLLSADDMCAPIFISPYVESLLLLGAC